MPIHDIHMHPIRALIPDRAAFRAEVREIGGKRIGLVAGMGNLVSAVTFSLARAGPDKPDAFCRK
jgi:hypothetical protein